MASHWMVDGVLDEAGGDEGEGGAGGGADHDEEVERLGEGGEVWRSTDASGRKTATRGGGRLTRGRGSVDADAARESSKYVRLAEREDVQKGAVLVTIAPSLRSRRATNGFNDLEGGEGGVSNGSFGADIGGNASQEYDCFMSFERTHHVSAIVTFHAIYIILNISYLDLLLSTCATLYAMHCMLHLG